MGICSSCAGGGSSNDPSDNAPGEAGLNQSMNSDTLAKQNATFKRNELNQSAFYPAYKRDKINQGAAFTGGIGAVIEQSERDETSSSHEAPI